MDININIKKLIAVVEEHKLIYDSTNKEYHDRQKKRLVWAKVYKAMHPSWKDADENDRIVFGKEVQKKWQSLRDCFRRELASQKNPPPPGKRKRSKYKYFDQLEFLTPFTQIMSDASEESVSCDAFSIVEESALTATDPLEEPHDSKKLKLPETKILFSDGLSEEEITVSEKASSKECINKYSDSASDDVAFLMSLLPSFKELNWEEKCRLRIQLLNTILTFKQSQREQEQIRTLSIKSEFKTEDNNV